MKRYFQCIMKPTNLKIIGRQRTFLIIYRAAYSTPLGYTWPVSSGSDCPELNKTLWILCNFSASCCIFIVQSLIKMFSRIFLQICFPNVTLKIQLHVLPQSITYRKHIGTCVNNSKLKLILIEVLHELV